MTKTITEYWHQLLDLASQLFHSVAGAAVGVFAGAGILLLVLALILDR